MGNQMKQLTLFEEVDESFTFLFPDETWKVMFDMESNQRGAKMDYAIKEFSHIGDTLFVPVYEEEIEGYFDLGGEGG